MRGRQLTLVCQPPKRSEEELAELKRAGETLKNWRAARLPPSRKSGREQERDGQGG